MIPFIISIPLIWPHHEEYVATGDIAPVEQLGVKHSERDYVLFDFGINTGLKITEILNIKVGDVIDEEGYVKDFYLLCNKEFSIKKEIYLNQ